GKAQRKGALMPAVRDGGGPEAGKIRCVCRISEIARAVTAFPFPAHDFREERRASRTECRLGHVVAQRIKGDHQQVRRADFRASHAASGNDLTSDCNSASYVVAPWNSSPGR